MKSHSVIIKFDECCTSTRYGICRTTGTVTADSITRLIDIADLEANPREAKTGSVTEAILETLENSPELFPFKSKGLLIASGSCRELERSRFELAFGDDDIEGILDGGHNMLAIAIHIISKAIGEQEARKALKGARRWDDVVNAWKSHRDSIEVIRKDLSFLVPVEIIYPQSSAEGRDVYEGAVLEIAQARNNNAQLTEETKANKAGLYDAIRKYIDPELTNEIEWKSNDGGRIKVRDLVALAWIPLSAIGEIEGIPELSGFSPTNIYRSKGQCVNSFNALMKNDLVTSKAKGDIRELEHPIIRSALRLMRDMPALYDHIYERFPEAYNSVSPGFGRISSVRIFEPGRTDSKDSKYLSSPSRTKFYRNEVKFDFPDGFIMPIVWGLRELIQIEDGVLSWKTDPKKFIDKNLGKFLAVYHGFIQMAAYDPQKVGKSASTYQLACNDFQGRLK
ncbi:AIPR family protein [bacterium BD-1]|nr:AIPR family protein [Ottowia caeni]